jgi:hypothetical protein
MGCNFANPESKSGGSKSGNLEFRQLVTTIHLINAEGARGRRRWRSAPAAPTSAWSATAARLERSDCEHREGRSLKNGLGGAPAAAALIRPCRTNDLVADTITHRRTDRPSRRRVRQHIAGEDVFPWCEPERSSSCAAGALHDRRRLADQADGIYEIGSSQLSICIDRSSR